MILECRHIDSYCLKRVISGKALIKVDDNHCKICLREWGGKPPMPGEIPPNIDKAEIFYFDCHNICKLCSNKLCPLKKIACKAGHYEKGYFCKMDKWPEPPTEELQRARNILVG